MVSLCGAGALARTRPPPGGCRTVDGAALSVVAPSVPGMDQTHHVIDYVEINVTDLATARAFYERAFGWEFNDYGGAYAGIRAPGGDGEIGGLNPSGPTGPGGVLVQLYSDDLEASVAAVEAAGGRVEEGPYEFPGGRRFTFADDSGNVLGVWTAAAPGPGH